MTLLELDGRDAALAQRAAAVQAAFGTVATPDVGGDDAPPDAAPLLPSFLAAHLPPLPRPPSEIARRLRALVRAADQVSADDLMHPDPLVTDALAELAFSYGVARLIGAVRRVRRADRAGGCDATQAEPRP